jgi:hypothetical protein
LKLLDGTELTDVPWASVADLATKTLGALGSIGLMTIVGVYLAADPDLYRTGFVRLMVGVNYFDRSATIILAGLNEA